MGLFWRILYTSVRSTGGKIFEYFLNIMQGDSDLWLHSLCVSTVQTAQSHQSRFYHKSSLPDFHANTTHLTAVLIIYNMFHVLFLFIFTIKNKVIFLSLNKEESTFQRAPIRCWVEQIKAFSLLFTLHILIKIYLKPSWSSLGLKFGIFGSFHLFSCFSFPLCEMSDTEPKLIAKCMDYVCVS